jgi:hypothetical protein
MDRSRRTRHAAAAFLAVSIAASAPVFAGAEEWGPLSVKWGGDFRELCFRFQGERVCYPEEMLRAAFPAPGAPPEFRFTAEWPFVSMTARWSVATKGWPEKYRPDAIDLVVMYACDADLYEYIFPDSISSSSFSCPPGFLREAEDSRYDLAGALRGKEVAYEVTAKGGFGAADYVIRTRIRIGVSADGKAVFYHDRPSYISDHLKTRDFFFAVRDAGDRLVFEVRMWCECAPALFFRGETMRRVEENGRYFVRRLHEDLDEPPTREDIEDYFRLVKEGKQSYEAYLRNHGLAPKDVKR